MRSGSPEDESAFAAVPVIPEHELLRPIASGAYGQVWLARSALGTLRAVKIVRRDRFDRAEDFDREFRGLQRFEPVSRTHEALVDILQIGRQDDWFYYVMELADNAAGERSDGVIERRGDAGLGDSQHSNTPTLQHSTAYVPQTLRQRIRDLGSLPVADVIALGHRLASALAHLHAQGLVHRDVKPSNILFINGQPKLADAGLVAAVDDARSLVGTPGYIPPEGPGTPKADIYSLGKVLYEAAFGKDRQEFPQLPPDLASRPDHAALLELNEIITKACARDPRQRYATAQALLAELELLQRSKSIRRKRTLQRVWKVCRTAAFVLIVLAFITVSILFSLNSFWRPISPGEGPPSTNEYATALCDKAEKIIAADNYDALPQANTNFINAIALDPNYARPYVGLFNQLTAHGVPGLPAPTPAELHRIVGKLDELAPNLPATHQAQSQLSYNDLDFSQAEKCIRQALKADRKVDPAWYGFMLLHWGRTVEARKQLEIARSIEPSLAIIFRLMGHTYYVERDYTNAIAWYQQALNWEPHHAPAFQFIGQAKRAMGDYTAALDELEKADVLYGRDDSETRQSNQELRKAFQERGVRGYWEEQWKQTVANPTNDYYWKAVIQIHLGATNDALALLNKSYDTRERVGIENPLTYLLFDECWDGLHDDPSFKEFLGRIGFTKVMRVKKGLTTEVKPSSGSKTRVLTGSFDQGLMFELSCDQAEEGFKAIARRDGLRQ